MASVKVAGDSQGHPSRTPLILALSGGGYRGYFTALVLAGLEARLNTRCNLIFDLIAGTSIGGILALGLAHGVSAATLAEMLKEHGPAIFPDRPFPGVRRIFGPPYKSAPLANAIRLLLPKQAAYSIGGSPCPVMVVSVSPVTAKIVVISSWEQGSIRSISVLDAALATSAAPTYFPVHRVKTGSGSAHMDLIDGGIAANAPDGLALHHAVHGLGFEESRIKVLSVGTCAAAQGGAGAVNPEVYGIAGTLGRLGGRGIVNLMMAVQEARGIGEARERIGNERYLRLDRVPSDVQAKMLHLDNASPEASLTIEQLARDVDADTSHFMSHGVWRSLIAKSQIEGE